ncbi:hypothetical protein E1A91_D06G125700v1, partial [Gossypium mustelinum]
MLLLKHGRIEILDQNTMYGWSMDLLNWRMPYMDNIWIIHIPVLKGEGKLECHQASIIEFTRPDSTHFWNVQCKSHGM